MQTSKQSGKISNVSNDHTFHYLAQLLTYFVQLVQYRAKLEDRWHGIILENKIPYRHVSDKLSQTFIPKQRGSKCNRRNVRGAPLHHHACDDGGHSAPKAVPRQDRPTSEN